VPALIIGKGLGGHESVFCLSPLNSVLLPSSDASVRTKAVQGMNDGSSNGSIQMQGELDEGTRFIREGACCCHYVHVFI